MAHAAATPNTRFAGTAMAVTMSVSSIADHASGSCNAAQYSPQPFLKASTNTATSGKPRNSMR
jgi:hypothetical protein